MSITTNNPYQSPKFDAQNAIDSEIVGDAVTRKQQATISYAAWAGVLFGGVFGLAGSLLLTVSRGVLLGWPEFAAIMTWQNAVEIPILGSISGIACGLMIGPFVGSLIAYGRCRLTALTAAVLMSASAGGMVGQLGAQMVVLGDWAGASAPCPPDAPVRLALMVGISIGALAGVLGGRQLGHRILAYHE